MTNSSIAISPDITAQLSSLVAPVQGVGNMLIKLAETISSGLKTGQDDQGSTVSESLTSDGGGSTTEGGTNNSGGKDAPSDEKKDFWGKVTDAAGATDEIERIQGVWKNYYERLFDNEKKLKKGKADALALEIGATILGTKKMAKARKALAIGNIVKGTAEAVMTAAKSAPFPLNLLPIGKAVAIGAQQLSAVKGQAHDGLTNVPSTGTYLLEKGERVVGNRLNADLQGFLASQAAVREVGGNSVTNSPTINLTINGDARDDAVASNRGALEGMIRDIFADYAMDAPFG